jgi:hypothetical protein
MGLRMDGQTSNTEQTVAFRNFANAPNNGQGFFLLYLRDFFKMKLYKLGLLGQGIGP